VLFEPQAPAVVQQPFAPTSESSSVYAAHVVAPQTCGAGGSGTTATVEPPTVEHPHALQSPSGVTQVRLPVELPPLPHGAVVHPSALRQLLHQGHRVVDWPVDVAPRGDDHPRVDGEGAVEIRLSPGADGVVALEDEADGVDQAVAAGALWRAGVLLDELAPRTLSRGVDADRGEVDASWRAAQLHAQQVGHDEQPTVDWRGRLRVGLRREPGRLGQQTSTLGRVEAGRQAGHEVRRRIEAVHPKARFLREGGADNNVSSRRSPRRMTVSTNAIVSAFSAARVSGVKNGYRRESFSSPSRPPSPSHSR